MLVVDVVVGGIEPNPCLFVASVCRWLVQDYGKLAYMFDQSRDYREKMLTMQLGKDHLKYLISFIDLLATCAEVRHRLID